MLKFNTQRIISVSDWDDLVIKTYGRIYSFQQQDGCIERQQYCINIPDIEEDYENSTVPEEVNHPDMGVSFAAWLERDPKQFLTGEDGDSEWRLDMWWQRNFYPNVQMIANDLHAKGLVEAGQYIIDIDW